MIGAIAVDMVERQELKGALAATRAGSAVRIKHRLFQGAPVGFAFGRDLFFVLASVASATFEMFLVVGRLPLPSGRVSCIKVVEAILSLVGKVAGMVRLLPLRDLLEHARLILLVPRAACRLGFVGCGHGLILPCEAY